MGLENLIYQQFAKVSIAQCFI